MAGMTFRGEHLSKKCYARGIFYGQHHGNGIQICNASPNINLKPSNARRLLTKHVLQTLGEVGSSGQMSRPLNILTQLRGCAIHQSTSQSILIECQQGNVMLNPDTSQQISYIYFVPFWHLCYYYYYYYYFSRPFAFLCRPEENQSPFANFSNVQISLNLRYCL